MANLEINDSRTSASPASSTSAHDLDSSMERIALAGLADALRPFRDQ
jgi:hypothetical protein